MFRSSINRCERQDGDQKSPIGIIYWTSGTNDDFASKHSTSDGRTSNAICSPARSRRSARPAININTLGPLTAQVKRETRTAIITGSDTRM